MVKMLALQDWYGLSDPELERQAVNRIDFRNFLGFPGVIPDSTTVWLFRERLAETGRERLVWEELQRQFDEKGLKVKKGVVQDASFITSDPGKQGKPRGEEARTRRSRDGDWGKKGGKSSYGYKLHAKTDVDLGLVRDLETTAASVHDSRVDLSRPGEVAYLDKAYFGVEIRGFSAAMRRGVRGHPLGIKDRLRNRRINRKRAPGGPGLRRQHQGWRPRGRWRRLGAGNTTGEVQEQPQPGLQAVRSNPRFGEDGVQHPGQGAPGGSCDPGGEGLRRIGVIVKEDGKLELETQGFQGEACLEETQKLLEHLEAMGLNVETTRLERTREHYAEEHAEAKVEGRD